MFRALRTFRLNGRQVKRFDVIPTVPTHLQGSLLRARFIEPFEATVEPSIASMKKAELLELADDMGVTVPTGAKVADIRELLEEAQ